ncbi:MAG: ATP-binding protein, partial [bacterium]
ERFAQRDAVLKNFCKFYREHSQAFPQFAGEADYERRMQIAYPIHPELFDRLYTDWSVLDKFQRTRGVLRLMACVIHELWEKNDRNTLILPGTIPLDAHSVHFELTQYLENNWAPVIEKDVDGASSTPLQLDRDNPTLGRYSACRRVARAIFMGSAPTASTKQPGIDDRRINLACAQPGESVATFGDAIRRLTDQATHLYVDGSRYWYSTQPSVTRLAQDRAAQQDLDNAWEELKKRLRAEKNRGDFAGLHAVPADTADVPDDMDVRLVILSPEHPHLRQSKDSPALLQAHEILANRGSSPRYYKNMLVFLTADKARMNDLELSLRNFLAWKSIIDDHDKLNLDVFQSNLAQTKLKDANAAVDAQTMEAYVWALVPSHTESGNGIDWEEIRIQGNDALAVRTCRKLKNDEHLITAFSATRLRMELDRYLWKEADHLAIKKLWEYFATYLYLPRLRDKNVLLQAIQEGIGRTDWTDNFAYAEAWDDEKQKYRGLKAGQAGSVLLDEHAVIVKPEAAQRQLDVEAIQMTRDEGPGLPGTSKKDTEAEAGGASSTRDKTLTPEEAARPKRFYGTVTLDPLRIARDAGQIAQEIIQHLTSLQQAKVQITLEIRAEIPDGADEQAVRTVTENCRTLKFRHYGFEKE